MFVTDSWTYNTNPTTNHTIRVQTYPCFNFGICSHVNLGKKTNLFSNDDIKLSFVLTIFLTSKMIKNLKFETSISFELFF